MSYRIIIVYFVELVLVGFVLADPLAITFPIHVQNKKLNDEGTPFKTLSCTHAFANKRDIEYTALEGEEFTITTQYYGGSIEHVFCGEWSQDGENSELFKNENISNEQFRYVATFQAEKRMGTVWNCSVLAHKDDPSVLPVVHYENHTYAVSNCYMSLHVRHKKSPLTILVNSMILQSVRTDLSEKAVDYTAEYHYADGDIVDVTCINFLNLSPITLDYSLADNFSDKFTSKNLSSDRGMGFVTKMSSEHDNTIMFCTKTRGNDYSKVLVRFIMRKKFNIVEVQVNGKTIRPKLKNFGDNSYEIEYKYTSNQLIQVTCEINNKDLKLFVFDRPDFLSKVSSYKKQDLIPGMKSEMSFYLEPLLYKKLQCVTSLTTPGGSESVKIIFTESNSFFDEYPMHMELPSDGNVMELYSNQKLRVVFYQYEVGESLRLKCKLIPSLTFLGMQMKYLQFNDSGAYTYESSGISETVVLTSEHNNSEIICYLKERKYNQNPSKDDKLLKEIRVILIQKASTITETSPTAESYVNLPTTPVDPTLTETKSSVKNTFLYSIAGVGILVFIIVVLVGIYFFRYRRCMKSSQQKLSPTKDEVAEINLDEY